MVQVTFDFFSVHFGNMANMDFLCFYTLYNPIMTTNDCSPLVLTRDVLHTSADNWCIRLQKRYCLTLHVCTHERTVRVIIFQERDTCRSRRYNLLWRYIHIINSIPRYNSVFPAETGNYFVRNEVTFFA